MKYFKKIMTISMLAIYMAFPLFGEEQILNQEDIIKLVEKNNAAVKISSSGTDLARSIYNQVLKSGNPNISFTTDSFTNPLYGYSNSSFSSTPISGTPVTESHTVSAGIQLSQLLPTGGTASLSIEDSLSFSRTDSNDSWEISQEPGIGINLRQPVFSNGSIIDFSALENSRRTSLISYEISRMDNLATKNNVLIAVLSSVHRTNILRQSRYIMEKGIILANLRVEMAREDRDRGRISSSELLGIELDVGRQQEALFDMEYQLALAEMEIERLLGIENASSYKFNLNLDNIKNSDSLESNTDSNPDVLKAMLNVEQKEIALSLNKLADAPVLNLFLQTGPRYPDGRTDTSDPVSSLTDLFSKDAGINLSFGVAFNMNIWDGGVSRSARESDLISLDISRQNLEESSREVNENRKVLLGKLKLIEDKIVLLKSNIEYDKQLLQREIDLQQRGSSTNVDVETVRLELLSRERDLQNIYGEKYITFLQISALDGKNLEDHIK